MVIKNTLYKIVFIVVFTMLSMPVICRDRHLPFKQQDIDKLYKNISKWFEKTDCYEPDENYRFITVYYIYYTGDYMNKEQISQHFNEYAEPIYTRGRKHLLMNETYICNKKGKFVAWRDYSSGSCISGFKESAFEREQQIVNMCIEKEIKYLYYFTPMILGNYLGIDRNNRVFIYRDAGDKYLLTPLKEVTNEEWKLVFASTDR